jgi:ribosomal protein S18 acetylase RimI-like enzyme
MTWREAYRDIMPAAYLRERSVEARADRWLKELEVLPSERRPWVAETPSGIVGFVSGGPARDEDVDPDTGEVYAIYVLPDCWDRGVGRTLLAHAERDLLAHGYTAATLWCLGDNERARRFYEQAGWRTDGASKLVDFGGQQAGEVRYRIALERSRVASPA